MMSDNLEEPRTGWDNLEHQEIKEALAASRYVRELSKRARDEARDALEYVHRIQSQFAATR